MKPSPERLHRPGSPPFLETIRLKARRFTLTALLAGTAPALAPCAYPKTPAVRSAPKKHHALQLERGRLPEGDIELLEKLDYLVMFIVNGGGLTAAIMDPETLRTNPVIRVDGYVTSIFSFGHFPLEVSFGDEKGMTMRFNPKNQRLIIYSASDDVDYEIDLREFVPDSVIRNALVDYAMKQSASPSAHFLPGFYHLGCPALTEGDPLNGHEAVMDLTFRIDDREVSFTVFQDPPLECTMPPCQVLEDLDVIYEGDDIRHLYNISRFEEKLLGIRQALAEVELLYPLSLDRFFIRDFGLDNATLRLNDSKISILTGNLILSNPRQTLLVARHEFLHLLTHRIGFTEDAELRGLFSDLKGLSGSDKRDVIERGRSIKSLNNSSGDVNFFRFISEHSAIPGSMPHYGHSHENVYEFYTSFFHSLLSADSAEDRLSRKTNIVRVHPYGMDIVERFFTIPEKIRMIQTHIDVLNAMLKFLNREGEVRNGVDNVRQFLLGKLEEMHALKIRYENALNPVGP